MKKVLKVMLAMVLMFNVISIKAFAYDIPSAEEISQLLLEHGVPHTYVGNAIEYLQKIEVTEEQYNRILSKIDEAEAILDGISDITTADDEIKNAVKNLISETAQVVGLQVVFGKDSTGVTTVVLVDTSGNNIAELNTFHVVDIVQNLDLNRITETVTDVVIFANGTTKDEFDPIDGDFNNTGNNYGNSILVGSGLIILSGVTFVVSRKVVAI